MTDRFEALERLARLRELNVLTPEEFAAEKARILSTDQPAATPMVEAAGLADEPDARKKWLPWAVGGGVAALAGAALAYSTMTEIKEFPERGSDKEAGANSTGEGKLEQGANADLGSLLKFDDPKTCQLGQKLRTLTSRMAAQQEGSGGGHCQDAGLLRTVEDEPRSSGW